MSLVLFISASAAIAWLGYKLACFTRLTACRSGRGSVAASAMAALACTVPEIVICAVGAGVGYPSAVIESVFGSALTGAALLAGVLLVAHSKVTRTTIPKLYNWLLLCAAGVCAVFVVLFTVGINPTVLGLSALSWAVVLFAAVSLTFAGAAGNKEITKAAPKAETLSTPSLGWRLGLLLLLLIVCSGILCVTALSRTGNLPGPLFRTALPLGFASALPELFCAISFARARRMDLLVGTLLFSLFFGGWGLVAGDLFYSTGPLYIASGTHLLLALMAFYALAVLFWVFTATSGGRKNAKSDTVHRRILKTGSICVLACAAAALWIALRGA